MATSLFREDYGYIIPQYVMDYGYINPQYVMDLVTSVERQEDVKRS